MSSTLGIILSPENHIQLVEVSFSEKNKPLTSILASAKHGLNMRCGGRGLCSGCQVESKKGAFLHLPSGKIVKPEKHFSACQHGMIEGEDTVILIPATSQVSNTLQVVDDFVIHTSISQAPISNFSGIGAAVDIGTTTVAVLLADIMTGNILGRTSNLNRQAILGDNVVTRINHCMVDKGKIRELQRLILDETIIPLLRKVADEVRLNLSELSVITLSGNTSMLHLVLGIDPSSMGTAPFTPTFLEHQCVDAASLGFPQPFRPQMPIHLLPGLSAYVGADINAGIVATGMHYNDGPNLLVDIGTNGEIVLKFGNRLLACATAAGPAFEGAGLSWGCHAIDGAVSKIEFDRANSSITLGFIRNKQPNIQCPGICGSAYIDFLGMGIEHEILTQTGRFKKEFATQHPDLFQTIDGEKLFILIPRSPKQECAITISEADIASLLQAKAAIAAGVLTLLAQTNLKPDDIQKLYLAGGFGRHLDVHHALVSGLLPSFSMKQIEVVGNAALAGAFMALQDEGILQEMKNCQAYVEIVELNLDHAFEDRFIENLMLGTSE